MQKAILLKFKRKAKRSINNDNYDIKYDYKLGVYIDQNLEPIISKYCRYNNIGRTLLTETREGIDQSENSELYYGLGETLITKSREGIDTSEVSA